MSDRPTPETDDLARGNHVVPTEWAQKLESERNEAREERDDAKTSSHEWAVHATRRIRERDEAREAFLIATDQMVIAQGKVREANTERDEERSVADELSAIAARYLWLHLSRTPMGPDDDHLAQARRIAEAIARWKALASA
jgi:hypothetical protein